MDKKYPGVPYVNTHSLPIGLYKDERNATPRGCYRNISDEETIRAAKSGAYISPTFTEWIMDGIWPDDITTQQGADMIDYYFKMVGTDHVGIASDELWKRGYNDEDIAKIYGGNKMRVYREVWEGFAPEEDPVSRAERDRFIDEQRNKFHQR